MKKLLPFILLFIFCLSGCNPQPFFNTNSSEDRKAMDIVLLGTYGYTTFEELGRTVEDYDAEKEYDHARLPDSQTGFSLLLPIVFYNQGDLSWYDPDASVTITITAPDGNETNLISVLHDAFIQRRRHDLVGQYQVIEKPLSPEFRIPGGKRRVFFFKTSYKPMIPGVYTLLVQMESKRLSGIHTARSGFTLSVT